MTDLRQAAMLALEALTYCEALNRDVEQQKTQAITTLRKALEQPEQEPSQWRDMVVVNLVREGINKHKARELADHFATPPAAQPEPVEQSLNDAVFTVLEGFTLPHDVRKILEAAYYTTPPAAQPKQVDCPRCGHVCSQRPWVGLTDDEITEIYEMGLGVRASVETALDKIEERNT
jgi:hypothetical protein